MRFQLSRNWPRNVFRWRGTARDRFERSGLEGEARRATEARMSARMVRKLNRVGAFSWCLVLTYSGQFGIGSCPPGECISYCAVCDGILSGLDGSTRLGLVKKESWIFVEKCPRVWCGMGCRLHNKKAQFLELSRKTCEVRTFRVGRKDSNLNLCPELVSLLTRDVHKCPYRTYLANGASLCPESSTVVHRVGCHFAVKFRPSTKSDFVAKRE